MGSVSVVRTFLRMRVKGRTGSRTPSVVGGAVAAALVGLSAFPVDQYSQILGRGDRICSTAFFKPLEGGSVWLYENLFWLLGHPEVYVILIPSTALMLELLPVFYRKPLFSFNFAVAGIVGVVALSAMVLAHHMTMTGGAPAVHAQFLLAPGRIQIPGGVCLQGAMGLYVPALVRICMTTQA